jgi:hypothetical protein
MLGAHPSREVEIGASVGLSLPSSRILDIDQDVHGEAFNLQLSELPVESAIRRCLVVRQDDEEGFRDPTGAGPFENDGLVIGDVDEAIGSLYDDAGGGKVPLPETFEPLGLSRNQILQGQPDEDVKATLKAELNGKDMLLAERLAFFPERVDRDVDRSRGHATQRQRKDAQKRVDGLGSQVSRSGRSVQGDQLNQISRSPCRIPCARPS